MCIPGEAAAGENECSPEHEKEQPCKVAGSKQHPKAQPVLTVSCRNDLQKKKKKKGNVNPVAIKLNPGSAAGDVVSSLCLRDSSNAQPLKDVQAGLCHTGRGTDCHQLRCSCSTLQEKRGKSVGGGGSLTELLASRVRLSLQQGKKQG